MTNNEAIETIKANYPPENYSLLREALDMAVALLKEQEPVSPIINEKVFQYATCGKCGQHLHWQGNYCQWCGQVVKWDE